MRESAACVQRWCVGAAAGRSRRLPEMAPALARMAASARRWNLPNPSALRRRCPGTAIGAKREGPPPRATGDLTGPPVMTLPMHMGDTREPHPLYFLFRAGKTRASIITVPNEPSTYGEPLRTERGARRASPGPEDITRALATTPPSPQTQPSRTVEPALHPRQSYQAGAAKPRCDHMRMQCRRSESWSDTSTGGRRTLSTLVSQCLDDWIDENRAAPDSVGTKVSFEVRSSPSASALSGRQVGSGALARQILGQGYCSASAYQSGPTIGHDRTCRSGSGEFFQPGAARFWKASSD